MTLSSLGSENLAVGGKRTEGSLLRVKLLITKDLEGGERGIRTPDTAFDRITV